MNLKEYLDHKGRGSGYRIAKKLGIQPTNLYLWAKKESAISPYRCAQLELLTEGAVTCEELKPDFDWKTLWSVFFNRISSANHYPQVEYKKS